MEYERSLNDLSWKTKISIIKQVRAMDVIP